MRWFSVALLPVILVASAAVTQGSRSAGAAQRSQAHTTKKHCKTVVKKVHGKKKKVRVCHTVTKPKPAPTVTPTPTPSPSPSPTPTATPSPLPTAATRVGAKAYYLALGDSLAYGYQPNFDVTHGYADDFYADLHGRGTGTLANMGCPGETSATFIKGGCPYTILLKTAYSGPQLQAALAFLHDHAGQVSPVTIDLGPNDLLALINQSTCSVGPGADMAIAAFDTNFRSILSQLHSALNGTGDLITMNFYDVYQNKCTNNPGVLAAVERVNGIIAADAAGYNVPVADVFAAFGGATSPNPHLCDYTWICNASPDIHPTSDGYSVIARAFEAAAGY